ncbi:MAG: AMP-binding protein [Bacillota bacterium]
MEQNFFHRRDETMSRAEAQEMQLRKLKWQVARCYENVPFYRRKFDEVGLKPEHIQKLSDITKIPFLTKEDLRQFYPHGLLAVPFEKVCHYHMTSGTTGLPVTVAHSFSDWERLAALQARQLVMQGLGPGDLLYQGYGYGTWIGGPSVDIGAHAAGIRVLPVGPGRTNAAMGWLKDFAANGITCTPSFMVYLIETARKEGIDPRKDWPTLKMSNMGGEAWSLGLRDKIERAMPPGFKAHNQYGTTEVGGPVAAASCPYSQLEGFAHTWADAYLAEIVDPESGESLTEPGQEGELVLTTLEREASPVLRFRTRDLTAFKENPYDCLCGRRAHPLLKWFTGRTDDILKIRGTMVAPRRIEDIITRIEGVGEAWMIVIERPEGKMDNLTIQLELEPALWEDPIRREEMEKFVAQRVSDELGIRVDSLVVPPNTLPRFERKAARVMDKRKM